MRGLNWPASTPEERAKVVEWFGKTLGKKRASGQAESKEGDG